MRISGDLDTLIVFIKDLFEIVKFEKACMQWGDIYVILQQEPDFFFQIF